MPYMDSHNIATDAVCIHEWCCIIRCMLMHDELVKCAENGQLIVREGVDGVIRVGCTHAVLVGHTVFMH